MSYKVYIDTNVFLDSYLKRDKDFEDGVQYFCAKSINADLIISNNKKDFKMSDIDVLTPEEFCLIYID